MNIEINIKSEHLTLAEGMDIIRNYILGRSTEAVEIEYEGRRYLMQKPLVTVNQLKFTITEIP